MSRGQMLDRDEREVREVLVVDGVELVLAHQPREMRELQRDDAFGFSSSLMPATKSLRSGTCASTLLPTMRSAFLPSAASSRPARRRRIRCASGCPCRSPLWRRWRPARCRAPARRAAESAGADSRRCWRARPRGFRCRDPSRSCDHLAIGAGVRNPGRRIRREVGILVGRCRSGLTYSFSCTRKQLSQTQRVQRKIRLHCDRAGRRAGSSRTAATCRGRRTCARRVRRTGGTHVRLRVRRCLSLRRLERSYKHLHPASQRSASPQTSRRSLTKLPHREPCDCPGPARSVPGVSDPRWLQEKQIAICRSLIGPEKTSTRRCGSDRGAVHRSLPTK